MLGLPWVLLSGAGLGYRIPWWLLSFGHVLEATVPLFCGLPSVGGQGSVLSRALP